MFQRRPIHSLGLKLAGVLTLSFVRLILLRRKGKRRWQAVKAASQVSPYKNKTCGSGRLRSAGPERKVGKRLRCCSRIEGALCE